MVMLVFDVSADDILVKTNGRDKVASGPEGFSFIESMGALDLFLHPG